MKKIVLIGFVLVALAALAALAFFGGCSSAPTPSATSAAAEEAVSDSSWNPPASSGRQAAEATKAAEEAAKNSSGDAGGSCVPNFFRGDGMSPVFFIVVFLWVLTQIIPTKIDDVILYGGLLIMTVTSFVGKGCLGEYNPFSPWWWLCTTIWVVWGVDALKVALKNRHKLLRWGAIAGIWLLLGVFS